ncbi:transcriptional regulator, AlpA family [Nannocystis exedens]|uniref:Transcriptional regulator, AlpA family n=1 Tax=Nannocystis exedens TaxID=54 RepID=A0A1I2ILY3_9BACT|nr:Prophage CP4-57 regulatory protein (AlpA) [Nannocystis exedens]SFF42643.1 transcriptional regulator, AlpA family [Nannocystis exedens]
MGWKPASASSALLRASEVAEWIGSTEAQVRNMRARAQLPPPVKIPGLGVRWLRSDLEKWLAQFGERH